MTNLQHPKKHIRTTQIQYKCDNCQFVSKNSPDFNDNMREKHIILKCKQCAFTSSSNVGLEIHTTKNHAFKCDYRDSNLGDKYPLKIHIKEVHEIKQKKT